MSRKFAQIHALEQWSKSAHKDRAPLTRVLGVSRNATPSFSSLMYHMSLSGIRMKALYSFPLKRSFVVPLLGRTAVVSPCQAVYPVFQP